MVKDDKFNQYGYNHYLKAPTRPSSYNVDHSISIYSRIMRKLQTKPAAIATLALVLALFVGVVIATYPSGDDEQSNIPIIKADLRPLKTQPLQRGGMSVANSDSTIMANVGGDADMDSEIKAIENLLARFSEETGVIVNKEDALNKAMEQNPMSVAVGDDVPASAGIMPLPRIDLVESTLSDEIVKEPNVRKESNAISAQDVLQKIGSSAQDITNETNYEFNQKVAAAAKAVKPKMPKTSKIYAAATAPDTLDFVRKILDEKAGSVSSIEPAIGAASPAANVSNTLYFVQLASITDPARAGSEWVKMQVRYNVLSDSKFRVQEASLSSGTFYRIQAGPMSKADADKICNSLKAQKKPGGCLVVK